MSQKNQPPMECPCRQVGSLERISETVVLLYEGKYGGVGGGVQCEGADRDDARLGVLGEVHEVEVVGGATGALKEHGGELARGGEDVIVKDVCEGGQGEVVAREVIVGGEVSIGEGKNGEGGVLLEIRNKRREGDKERGK